MYRIAVTPGRDRVVEGTRNKAAGEEFSRLKVFERQAGGRLGDGPARQWRQPALVTGLACIRDDCFVSSGFDGRIHLWAFAGPHRPVAVLSGSAAPVLALSPLSGTRFATVSGDTQLRIWDAERGVVERECSLGGTGGDRLLSIGTAFPHGVLATLSYRRQAGLHCTIWIEVSIWPNTSPPMRGLCPCDRWKSPRRGRRMLLAARGLRASHLGGSGHAPARAGGVRGVCADGRFGAVGLHGRSRGGVADWRPPCTPMARPGWKRTLRKCTTAFGSSRSYPLWSSITRPRCSLSSSKFDHRVSSSPDTPRPPRTRAAETAPVPGGGINEWRILLKSCRARSMRV